MLLNRIFLLLCLCVKQLVTDPQVGECHDCQTLWSCPEVLPVLANPKKGSEEHLRQLLCDNKRKVCCGISLEYTVKLNSSSDLVDDAAAEIHVGDAVECDSVSFSSENEFTLPSLPAVRAKDLKTRVEFTKCIGALVNTRYVLTSARCVVQDNQRQNEFSLVGVRFELSDNWEKHFGIEEQLPHPFYNEDAGLNDIALLRLSSTITDDNIQPTCLLPHAQKIFGKPGDKFVTVGKFAMCLSNHSFNNNVAVRTKLMSTDNCEKEFKKNNMTTAITMYNFCTTDIGNTTIACDSYDSVPVFFFSYGGHLLKGISSKGICTNGLPEVYTNLTAYFDWILDSMRPWPVNNVPCKTPNGETGNCISLRYCPAVMEEFGNPYKGSEGNLLKFICSDKQKSHLSDVSHVCCSTASNPAIFENKSRSVLNNTIQNGFFESQRCGLQHRDDYFASDEIVTIDEYPWLARLIIGANNSEYQVVDHSLCSGSLINARYVITAASCFQYFIGINTVRLGDFHQGNNTDCFVEEIGTDCSDYEDYIIEEKIIHPFFIFKIAINNIALLRLNKTVGYTDFIRPICLPGPDTITANAGDILYASGWGLDEKNDFVQIKVKVGSPLIRNSECRRLFRKNRAATFISSLEMCTKDFDNYTQPLCVFDGGPLMFHKRYQWHIEGILSATTFPCNGSLPGRYTRVAKYFQWIKDNMRPWREMFSVHF